MVYSKQLSNLFAIDIVEMPDYAQTSWTSWTSWKIAKFSTESNLVTLARFVWLTWNWRTVIALRASSYSRSRIRWRSMLSRVQCGGLSLALALTEVLHFFGTPNQRPKSIYYRFSRPVECRVSSVLSSSFVSQKEDFRASRGAQIIFLICPTLRLAARRLANTCPPPIEVFRLPHAPCPPFCRVSVAPNSSWPPHIRRLSVHI